MSSNVEQGEAFHKTYVSRRLRTSLMLHIFTMKRQQVLINFFVGVQGKIKTEVKSRVAMDFTGNEGRIITDPNEALGVAIEEAQQMRVSLKMQ